MAWNIPRGAGNCINYLTDYNQMISVVNDASSFWNDCYDRLLPLKLDQSLGDLSALNTMTASDCWNTVDFWYDLQERIETLLWYAVDWSEFVNGASIYDKVSLGSIGPAIYGQGVHLRLSDDGSSARWARFASLANAELSSAGVTGYDFNVTGWTNDNSIPWTHNLVLGGTTTNKVQAGTSCIDDDVVLRCWAACKVLQNITLWSRYPSYSLDSSTTLDQRNVPTDRTNLESTVCATAKTNYSDEWANVTYDALALNYDWAGCSVYRQYDQFFDEEYNFPTSRIRTAYSITNLPTGTNVDIKIANVIRMSGSLSYQIFHDFDSLGDEFDVLNMETHTNNASATKAFPSSGLFGNYATNPLADAAIDCGASKKIWDYQLYPVIAMRKTIADPT